MKINSFLAIPIFVYRFLCIHFYRRIRLIRAYLYQNQNGHKVELIDTYLLNFSLLSTIIRGESESDKGQLSRLILWILYMVEFSSAFMTLVVILAITQET